MLQPEDVKFLFDSWLASFILVFARVLGFVHIGPAISQTSIPMLVRIGFAFLLTIVISSVVPAAPKDMNSYNYALSIVLNLLAGMFVGYLTRLVLDIVQVAGEVMDNQLGLNSVSLFDPTLGQTTTLSLFFRTFAVVLFLYCGGMEMTLISFLKSFEVFPLTAFDFTTFQINMPQVLQMTGQVVTLGIIASSPIIVVILFMDVVLGLMSRAASQINPFSLSFSLKPVVGALVLVLIFPFLKAKIIEIILKGVQIF
ncbi:MAG: flagellar biosynthetic protein FliR [Candidatus Caenarcaniphilales bacterium]|nr:flagellar biosynthetic protein FliR [Candidatus Caenarcaniphilales bacterium]